MLLCACEECERSREAVKHVPFLYLVYITSVLIAIHKHNVFFLHSVWSVCSTVNLSLKLNNFNNGRYSKLILDAAFNSYDLKTADFFYVP